MVLIETSSRTLCLSNEIRIKFKSGSSHAVSRQCRLLRPLKIDLITATNDPQTTVAHPTGGVHTHE